MHVRIEDTSVAEIVDFDPTGEFHPALLWISVPEDIRPWLDQSWIVDGDGDLHPEDLEDLKREMFAKLKAHRWDEMVKPVTVEINGEPVRFGYDRDSDSLQKKLSVAQVIEAQAEEAGETSPYSFTFSAMDGPVTMTKADIITAGLALETHVQACFDREAEIWTDLQSRRTTHTLIEAWNDQIDEGWPAA